MMKKRQWASIIIVGILFVSFSGSGRLRAAERGTVILWCPGGIGADEGWKLGVKAAETALRESGTAVTVQGSDAMPSLEEGTVLAIRRNEKLAKEEYRLGKDAGSGSAVFGLEGGERGGMYGLFKLAERIRMGESLAGMNLKGKPAFALRMFAEEGQMLDIPDRGYYSETPPFVNEEILRAEVEELKEQARQAAGMGYNALSILHLNTEEYIDYRYYDKPVYPQDDRHRVRSAAFCRFLKELCDYVHSLHLEFYIQVYELQYPPILERYCRMDMDDPELQKILSARYRELFERLPLDGIIVTPNETHPRVGYKSKTLWKSKGVKETFNAFHEPTEKQKIAGAAKMCSLYQEAIAPLGKRCFFRMWQVGEDSKSVEQMAEGIPSDATLIMKETGGDYYLNYPASTAMTSGAARRQRLMIEFDMFREFDGWSRLFIFMKRWKEMVRSCRDTGVIGINAWGDWAEGCIWPDYEPGYLRDEQNVNQAAGTEMSWRGKWNSFRMMTRGFTPGQANVYLLSRLAWNPDDSAEEIAEDFAAMHIGKANAKAGAGALLATEDAFAEEYIGVRADITHPCYIKWTMVFSPRAEFMEKAYQGAAFSAVMESNARAMRQIDRIERAFAETRRDDAPNAERYEQFRIGFAKTCLYLRTFYLWRECWWRNRADADLKAEEKDENATRFRQAKAEFMQWMDLWKEYPEEAGYWRVTFRYGRPVKSEQGIFPYWYPRGEMTMETSMREFDLQ